MDEGPKDEGGDGTTLQSMLDSAMARLLRLYALVGCKRPNALGGAQGAIAENETTKEAIEAIRISRVLQEWYYNPEYLDEDGNPDFIQLTGTRSLAVLLEINGLEDNPAEMAIALKKNGLLEVNQQGHVRPATRVAGGTKAVRAGVAIRGVLSALNTAERNLSNDDPRDRWLHRTAHVMLPSSKLSELDELTREQGTNFLFWVDDWCKHQCETAKPNDQTVWVDVNIWLTPKSTEMTRVVENQSGDSAEHGLNLENVTLFRPRPKA
jgi:hypothetical protein